jgi:hypothetical protein
MSRRSLISIGAVVVALLLLIVWLLWPQPAAPGAGARLREAERAATVSPPELPLPAERSEPEPAVAVAKIDESVESPMLAEPEADLRPLKQIDIGVIQPSGEPLSPCLRGNLRELNWLHAVATTEPLGDRLPDSIAPFYSWMGLGTFDRPQQGNSNPNPTVPGFIGTLTLPHAMPVCINLAVGPIVLGVQRLSETDDTALFIVDPTTVQRLAGSLRLLVLSAETRQPIEGAAIELGLGSNLTAGGENGHTDDLGVCEVHGLAPGRTQLWVSARGFEERGLDATIPQGDMLDFGTVELQRTTTISGRVVDATGQPVSQPYVTVFLDDASLTSSILSEPYMATKGDEDGSFQLDRLGPRRYVLAVLKTFGTYADSSRAQVAVDATDAPVDDLLVTVEHAPAVTFFNPAGRDGVSIHLRSEAAPCVDWWPDIPYLASPDDMKFCLLPGRYAVESAVPGQALRTRPLVVGSEPMDFDVSR